VPTMFGFISAVSQKQEVNWCKRRHINRCMVTLPCLYKIAENLSTTAC
jgi:hypothetical protein